MFEYLIGKVTYKNNIGNYLLVENNFVGYKLFVSNVDKYELDKYFRFYVYFSFNEEIKSNLTPHYFAFKNIKEKLFFESLIKITGIGPKTALAILKNDLSIVKELIINQDIETLSELNGLNKKIANTLIANLSYKLKQDSYKNQSNSVEQSLDKDADTKNDIENNTQITKELIDALKSLGYTKIQIEEVINSMWNEISVAKIDQISELISNAIKLVALNDKPTTN